jgi:hypothetical protein
MKRRLIVAAALGVATLMASTAGAQTARPLATNPPNAVGPRFVDANGDGVCDTCTGTRGQGQKVRKGKGGSGPGNGTGHQGMGPRDGSGRGGGGNCNGGGPRGPGRGRR